MTTSKRSFLLRITAVAAASAGLLSACSKPAEPTAAPAAAAPAAVEASAPAADKLKAAWVYVGPVGSAGWSFAHDLGRKAVVEKFGDKIETTFVESVPEGADAERVFRDLATQGNKIIFGTSFGFMDAMLKVAADFPDVKFEHATGYKTAANMNVYDSRFYQDTYMAGVIAGSMTKSNVLGFVGSVPIPEVLRNINAFTLGAQSVNPKIETRVVWVNSWYNPPKEGEAAVALMNGGADILLQNTDSPAVLQAAQQAGKLAFGWDSDMSSFGPEAHLGSAIADWSHYYNKVVQEHFDGTWKGGQTTRWGVPENQNDLIKISDKVPAEVKAKVEAVKASLKDRSFDVFTGPIVDNKGAEKLAAGVKADDAWMGGINFYVKGVEGTPPTGN